MPAAIVTEDEISRLVDCFYGRVRNDSLLGPIFAGVIGDDWAPHLAKMKSFWSSVMLASRTYKGNPMMAHLQLPRLRAEHFERWLDIWRQTTSEICSEAAADMFVGKAEMIGERFLQAITIYGSAFSTESGKRVGQPA